MSATAVRPLLTIAEAAVALKIGKTKLYELFAAGDLRWVQVGAHRRVSAVEIDRFIKANTQAASA